MSTLRSLRLLGAVEAGTVSGAQLQTYLIDAGRASELSVLLASRGQSRRMAGSPLTMAAIVASPAGTDIVFKSATKEANAACAAVVTSAIAMSSVSNNAPSLQVVAANPVAWGLFNKSAHYESNIKPVLALYAGVTPAVYPTITALVADPDAMASIAGAPYAMSALVASPATTTIVAASSVSMALVANNAVAIDIVAKETAVMGIIANSTPAMTEIVSRSIATNRMASYPGAISAIAASSGAWSRYLAGPFFADNLPLALANMIGVSPGTFPTLASIIASPLALGKVAGNTSAVQALASNSAAMSTLAVSPNIGIILGSGTAMAVIGPNTSAMGTFLGSSGAWAGLFASSVAKGYIVISTALVDAIAGNSALLAYLGGLAKTAAATGIPDGVIGKFQPFTTVPSKVLVLSAKEIGIAATYSPYKFGGGILAGTQAGKGLSLTAAATLTHVAGYSDMTWDLEAAGVTAATLPIVNYIDMT